VPLYEYECKRDGRFEVIRKFSDPALKKCPKCGGPIQKLPSAPAIQFKGTGWYVTDYARKSSGDGSKGKESSSSGDTSSSSKSDSGKSDSGKSDSSKSDSGKSDSSKSDTKKTSTSSGSSSGSGSKS
jgi:putative FmdB family regulatory protein